MTVTTTDRHLLVQLQTGQTAAGKPKLQKRAYPHVDVAATDTAISSVLQAIMPLFSEPIYAMGRVDTVQIGISTSSGTGSTGGSSGATGGTSAAGTSSATTSSGPAASSGATHS